MSCFGGVFERGARECTRAGGRGGCEAHHRGENQGLCKEGGAVLGSGVLWEWGCIGEGAYSRGSGRAGGQGSKYISCGLYNTENRARGTQVPRRGVQKLGERAVEGVEGVDKRVYARNTSRTLATRAARPRVARVRQGRQSRLARTATRYPERSRRLSACIPCGICVCAIHALTAIRTVAISLLALSPALPSLELRECARNETHALARLAPGYPERSREQRGAYPVKSEFAALAPSRHSTRVPSRGLGLRDTTQTSREP